MAQAVVAPPSRHQRHSAGSPLAAQVARAAALILAGACFPIVVFELALTLFGPFLPGEYQLGLFMVPHERYGQFHAPNTVAWFRTDEYRSRVQTNHLGLRGAPVQEARTEGVGRILVAGDSFVEARQVGETETLPAVLASALHAESAEGSMGGTSAARCEVINAGVAGWGTGEEYVYLRDEGLRLQPDLVVLVFYLGNDVTNNLRRADPAPGWHAGPGFRVDAAGSLQALPFVLDSQPSPAGQALRRFSLTYNYLESGVLAKLDDGGNADTPAGIGRYELFSSQEPSTMTRGWRLTEALLAAIKQETERAGSQLMLVAAPTAYQVHADEQRRFLRADRGRKAGVRVDAPNRRLAEIAGRLGLPYFDLLPAMTRVAANTRLYFRQDPHWTVAGSSVAGTEIARELHTRPGLLPQGCARPPM